MDVDTEPPIDGPGEEPQLYCEPKKAAPELVDDADDASDGDGADASDAGEQALAVKGEAQKNHTNTLPDDVLVRLLARVHLGDRVQLVCKRWRTVRASNAYTVARRASTEPLFILCGGRQNFGEWTPRTPCRVFDLMLRPVAELAPRQSRCAGSALIPGLGVLVLGGHGEDHQPTARAWVHDLQARSAWRHWADLPAPCYYPSLCALGESIYVVYSTESRLLRYDKQGNLRETIQKPEAIRHPFNSPTSLNVLNGRLFFLSRVDAQDDIFRLDSYDPATGEWRRMPDPPIQALGLKAAVLAGKLYVMGGMVWSDTPGARPGDVDTIADVQVFDGQEWSVGPPLPSREAFEYAVSVGDSILAITNVMSSNRAFVLCNGAWRREQFPYFHFFADCAVAGGHSA